MSEDRVDRRLAAIFAGDVASYSRLMGADEEGTLRQLKAHRKELIDPKITEHRGRIVKTTGDGMLVEFVSVVDAVRCAVDIQRGMAERNDDVPTESRIEFRIGINVGDIISDDNDIYGDGVNVAARLEALAEPGGIMVSRNVFDQVRDKLSFGFEDMGEQAVKNIARPVGVHRVSLVESIAPIVVKAAAVAAKTDVSGADRPSIAVLPFANMSGDPEQEYFADGISEDIITGLSKLRWLFVIARNSSFTFKGKAVDVKHVARELGVGYVLEGSVRKGGNRVRITAQLIDAATNNHIWADHYDGDLTDIFTLQDGITKKIVAAIEPKLLEAEGIRSQHRAPEDRGVWDMLIEALQAESYPSKTVTIIVPLAAGTGMDTFARTYAELLAVALGKPVEVDNRPGAALMTGTAMIAAAPPDGHTLGVSTAAAMAVSPVLYKKVSYDPDKDFTPIYLYVKSPFVLIVDPALPINTVPELIKYARDSANPMTYSSPGAGVLQHLSMEFMAQRFGLKMTHVPYRNSMESITDIAAGHVSLGFAEIGASLPLIRDGKVRAIAVSSSTRIPTLPDVPPLGEASGMPDFEAVSWHILFAPAGTPKEIVQRLYQDMKRIMMLPDMKQRALDIGLLPLDSPSSVEGIRDYIKSEQEKWSSLVKKLGLEGSQSQ